MMPNRPLDGIGELDLFASPGDGVFERGKDGRRQDIAADDRQIGRSRRQGRLLDQVLHLVNPTLG